MIMPSYHHHYHIHYCYFNHLYYLLIITIIFTLQGKLISASSLGIQQGQQGDAVGAVAGSQMDHLMAGEDRQSTI